jgi:hypothetical protein
VHGKSIPHVSFATGEAGDLTKGELTRFDSNITAKSKYAQYCA